MKRTSHLIFAYQDQSISQYLRIQPSEYVGFLYAGWWKEREREKGEEENPFTPPLLHKGSLCWLVERERGKSVESKIDSKIFRVLPLYLGVL
jgi:hypothetical protein